MQRPYAFRWFTLAGLARAAGLLLPAAVGFLGFGCPGMAAATAWVEAGPAQLRLVPGTSGVGSSEAVGIGLQIRLEPGWETYWRTPGDAGIPPRFDWSRSGNLAEAELHWPAPQRFTRFGLESFGYVDEVVLPIRLRPGRKGQAIAVRLDLSFGLCREICIPWEASLALDLPQGEPVATGFASLIETWRARVPGPAAAGDLRIERAALDTTGAGRKLVVAVASEQPMDGPDLLVEGPAGVSFGKPGARLSPARNRGLLELPLTGAATLQGASLRLTLLDGLRAVEGSLQVAAEGAEELRRTWLPDSPDASVPRSVDTTEGLRPERAAPATR